MNKVIAPAFLLARFLVPRFLLARLGRTLLLLPPLLHALLGEPLLLFLDAFLLLPHFRERGTDEFSMSGCFSSFLHWKPFARRHRRRDWWNSPGWDAGGSIGGRIRG